MKLLVIGSGGREHAIAWKLSESPEVEKIYCAPGNGGTSIENKCENINITGNDELLNFAVENNVDFTVVGPEVPLVDGIVDLFQAKGKKIFGPSKKAAQLEGSKSYAKEFMKKYGVKTASYEVFTDVNDAVGYLKKCSYPVVLKADGLAAGKGVVICSDFNQAKKTAEDFMISDIFKGSGLKIVIEEFLEGVESTILAVTDGETIIPFISSKDHKTIFENNKGPNTGGMGVFAKSPFCTDEVISKFENSIMYPTLSGIKKEGFDYRGIIYFGIMITKKGVYLLEYNVRLGDPETQAVLPLMKSNFLDLLLHAEDKKLSSFNIEWYDKSSCCVVAASSGYPGHYETGYGITISRDIKSKIFIAGAKYENHTLKTTGGRVLAVVASGDTLSDARDRAYNDLEKVKFKNMYYRRDIGKF